MNEKSKKPLTKLYSVLLILLAAALAVVSVLPIVTFNAAEVEYADEYYTGSFTTNMEQPDTIDLGLISIINFAKDIGDALKVIRVQAGTESVDEAERERLAERLDEDEGFANSILLFYAFGGLVDDDGEEDLISQDDYGEMLLVITGNILSICMVVALVLSGIVFSIVLAIKFIVLLIKSLKHLKDDTDEDIDKRMDKYPFTVYAAMMFIFYVLCAMFSSGISMGSAIIGALVVLAASSVVRLLKTFAFVSKNEMAPMIVKQVITAVSLVAIIAVLSSFLSIGLFNEFNTAAPTMSKMQYDLIAEELLESGAREPYVTARDQVTNNNTIYAIAYCLIAFLAGICITIGIICAIERLGNKKTKMKTGEIAPYKPMIVLAVIVLIIAIVPTFLAVDSADVLEESYEKGQFKIWYTEYQEEGTKANIEYELLKEFKEAGDEELAELHEELKTADEEKAEDIAEQIEKGEKMVKEAENKIKEIEARAKRPTICMIAAVVFLLSEIAYLVVPKVLFKNKKEEEPAVEAELVE